MPRPFKIPESVLVVIYTLQRDVLLIRRADANSEGEDFWQSVTGSKDALDEPLHHTAMREVFEETGIDCSPAGGSAGCLQDWHLENVYNIYPRWRHRYAPGVTLNTEHLFGLQVQAGCQVRLNPNEHTDYLWLPYREAAERCFSPSNAEAILLLDRFAPPCAGAL